jgi:xanthine dehydrogenase iron-sulfur cluster and FAD-binding subunit A
MLNQVILVGKLTGFNEFLDNAKQFMHCNMSLNLSYCSDVDPQQEDVYVSLSETLCRSVKGYCAIGSTVGIKAHLEVKDTDVSIIADKITFINERS